MKRVLFDENMPRKLRRDLPEFAIRTVQEQGWSGLKNGALLSRAAGAIESEALPPHSKEKRRPEAAVFVNLATRERVT